MLTPPWWFEEGRRIDRHARAGDGWRVGRTLVHWQRHAPPLPQRPDRMHPTMQPDVIDLYEEPFSLVALADAAAAQPVRAAGRARLLFGGQRRAALALAVPRDRARCPATAPTAPTRRTPTCHASCAARASRTSPSTVIPLGVDVDRFASASGHAAARTFRDRAIGFVGRFEPVKGLDVLLDAVQRLTHAQRRW